MINIKDLKKKFANKFILNNVSFNISKGEIVALTGKSGCGKSTLLRILANLENKDSGNIKLNGDLVMVLQGTQLFPHLNVLENITYVSIKVNKKPKAEVHKQAIVLLKLFDLEDHKKNYPKSLSGGQQQRVALVRALMLQPDILILDEPTSALDATSATAVGKSLYQLKNLGKTVLFSSHDIDFNTKYAERIINLA
ncbi:MAG: amino acid ABC transporter ATP-binding protein [Francisellaceae bacterium]|jgi:polar amino acid transport system ATP-binding protein|nr:amino acid ABC transporter ATP-binding protein [Francisellaceae bacterium]MBT6206795.1 amino acid ABC transporter ATP-binding protein [Francisellaceae bacterium]MBT6539511.1 amino acid ABC transporter ATP-binding protein [Francisellaceae bacterium]